jgi:hypothetical protein
MKNKFLLILSVFVILCFFTIGCDIGTTDSPKTYDVKLYAWTNEFGYQWFSWNNDYSVHGIILSDLEIPDGILKSDTVYKITITGESDKDIPGLIVGFYNSNGSTYDNYICDAENNPHSISKGKFFYETTLTTYPNISSYAEDKNCLKFLYWINRENNPSDTPENTTTMATLSNLTIIVTDET